MTDSNPSRLIKRKLLSFLFNKQAISYFKYLKTRIDFWNKTWDVFFEVKNVAKNWNTSLVPKESIIHFSWLQYAFDTTYFSLLESRN